MLWQTEITMSAQLRSFLEKVKLQDQREKARADVVEQRQEQKGNMFTSKIQHTLHEFLKMLTVFRREKQKRKRIVNSVDIQAEVHTELFNVWMFSPLFSLFNVWYMFQRIVSAGKPVCKTLLHKTRERSKSATFHDITCTLNVSSNNIKIASIGADSFSTKIV